MSNQSSQFCLGIAPLFFAWEESMGDLEEVVNEYYKTGDKSKFELFQTQKNETKRAMEVYLKEKNEVTFYRFFDIRFYEKETIEKMESFMMGRFFIGGNSQTQHISKLELKDVATQTKKLNQAVKYFPWFLELRVIDLQSSEIGVLDTSKNKMLEEINIGNTPIESYDPSKNTLLKTLHCPHAKLGALDVSKNEQLEELNASFTNISSLDLSQNSQLKKLQLTGCADLTSISFPENPTELYAVMIESCPKLDRETIARLKDLEMSGVLIYR